MEDFELMLGEEVVKEIRADYWECLLGLLILKTRGNYYITNKRILFKGGFTIKKELLYTDIESLKFCMINLFIPTGIKILKKDHKAFYMSVLKRKEVLNLIEMQMTA